MYFYSLGVIEPKFIANQTISAGLKQACPEGIFVSLTPGDPSLWSGVLFVRDGESSDPVTACTGHAYTLRTSIDELGKAPTPRPR